MKELKKSETFTIHQVSKLTGLSKQVIRKWEERYGIIQPNRLENGYRIYSYDEIVRLREIVKIIDEGFSVKQAIEQMNEKTFTDFTNLSVQDNENVIQDIVQSLLIEGKAGNDAEILHLLENATHSLGIKIVVNEIVIPFLKKVGDLWCTGEWGEYQEALASQTIRDFLANLRRNIFVKSDAPLILGSCLPNERHEIPLHILLIQSMLKGYRTKMLGTSPSLTAIQSTVQLAKPQIVLLSAVTIKGFEDSFQHIQRLDNFAGEHQGVNFFLGGPGALSAMKNQQLKYIKLTNDLSDIFK